MHRLRGLNNSFSHFWRLEFQAVSAGLISLISKASLSAMLIAVFSLGPYLVFHLYAHSWCASWYTPISSSGISFSWI